MTTFIEQARRAQIIEAAVETLAQHGYAKTSLAKVAQTINVSTALISYHFSNKADLMHQVLVDIMTKGGEAIAEQTIAAPDEHKLEAYIKANIMYMGTRPKQFKALVEIIMGARDESGVLKYNLQDNETILTPLELLLTAGQDQGYHRQFEVRPMALAIRGAIDTVLLNTEDHTDISLEQFAAGIADLFHYATKKEGQ